MIAFVASIAAHVAALLGILDRPAPLPVPVLAARRPGPAARRRA